MTAQIYYEVRGHRAPVASLLSETPLQRFVELDHATREQLDGNGLLFGEVREYLTRALKAKRTEEILGCARDILLYRAVAWLVMLQSAPATPFSELDDLAIDELTGSVVGIDIPEDASPKDEAEEPVPAS